MKKIILFSISIIMLTTVYPQTTSTSEIDKAESYFKTASVVTFNEDYNPKDYIGSLIYYKPNDEKNLRVLKITKPNDSSIVRTQIDDILYQKMHTKDEVVHAKFLGIFNTTVTYQNLLEVLLIRDYSLEAQSYLTDPILYKQITRYSKPLVKNGYKVEFVWKVNVNKITSRVFKEGNAQAGFNYMAELSGKNYVKTEDFTKKILTTLQTIDVSIYNDEEIKSDDKSVMKDETKFVFEKDIINLQKPKDYIMVGKLVIENAVK